MSFSREGFVLKIIDIAGKSKVERELHFGGKKGGRAVHFFPNLSS
jgi:hypothetical protein